MDGELQLHGFTFGNPTYAPSLKTIKKWDMENKKELTCRIQRIFALDPRFNKKNRDDLTEISSWIT